MNITSLPPRVEDVTFFKKLKWWIFRVVGWLLMGFLIISAGHVAIFYIRSLFLEVTETISLKYAVYIVIGAFFCLVIYRNELKDMFGWKTDIDFIEETIKKK